MITASFSPHDAQTRNSERDLGGKVPYDIKKKRDLGGKVPYDIKKKGRWTKPNNNNCMALIPIMNLLIIDYKEIYNYTNEN